jgi:hypothetical protein
VSGGFREEFYGLAGEAGRALPDYPKDANAGDFWLHRLYFHLWKNKINEYLRFFDRTRKGRAIVRMCKASTTFCALLRRQALEQRHSSSTAIRSEASAALKPHRSESQRRATAIEKILRELRTIKTSMHNEGHFDRVRREHPTYLTFKIAKHDADVKQWVSNIADRRDLVKLAQEIASRGFRGVTLSTIKTDWSHRKRPR